MLWFEPGQIMAFWETLPCFTGASTMVISRNVRRRPAVIGAVVQLGKCFDLLDESITTCPTFGGH